MKIFALNLTIMAALIGFRAGMLHNIAMLHNTGKLDFIVEYPHKLVLVVNK